MQVGEFFLDSMAVVSLPPSEYAYVLSIQYVSINDVTVNSWRPKTVCNRERLRAFSCKRSVDDKVVGSGRESEADERLFRQ